jgi:hypothetical protein
MAVFEKLFGLTRGTRRAVSRVDEAIGIPASVIPPVGQRAEDLARIRATIVPPSSTGPAIVPHPKDIPGSTGPAIVPDPRDMPFKAGPLAAPQARSPVAAVAVTPKRPITGERYGPVERVGSIWDELKALRGGRLDRVAGAAASVATSKYVLAGLAATGIAGLTGYGAYAGMTHQVNMHTQVSKQFNKMRNSLAYGGGNRKQDFEYNPMMTFSRPRVRGGHLGAGGGLTLAMNNTRTRR